MRFHVHAYVPLLGAHIQKEDRVLYPMASDAIPAEVMDRLAEDFEGHERHEMGEGKHEELRRLAARLIEAYPPAGGGDGPSCGACGFHAAEAER